MNARFWIHRGGWVKLTLEPGQAVEMESGGPTEEGYSYTSERFEYVTADDEGPDRIVCRVYESSRDCDGPMISGRTFWASIADGLRVRDMAAIFDAENWPEEHKASAGILAPEWQKGKGWQRDVYAEAAGY